MARLLAFLLLFSFVLIMPVKANQLLETALKSVVSVLPVWAGNPQGGSGAKPGMAPEGTGIVIGNDGLIVTAWHVIERAHRVDIRLFDGRILPALPVAFDEKTDIALLRVKADLPEIARANNVQLGEKVCAIGNAYGLDLSLSCGIVSRKAVSNAGFNEIEDFIQTDAAANPGSSGGALVNHKGALVGMIAAIFASGSDNNIGINFALSNRLLDRVIDDLLDDDRVDYFSPGWTLGPLSRDLRAKITGAMITDLDKKGPAARAGFLQGDIITQIDGKPIRDQKRAATAIALMRLKTTVSVRVLRKGRLHIIPLSFETTEKTHGQLDSDCPYPAKICRLRQAVFPVSAYDPAASSVRISQNLLVTNRHVVGDEKNVHVITPNGVLQGRIIPSTFDGDLALIEVHGLPEKGEILDISLFEETPGKGLFYTIGADVEHREIRVFQPGKQLLPMADAPFARLHVSAFMKPGVSGGALVNENGHLIGIAVGGGEGRFEALPIRQVKQLLQGRNDPEAKAINESLAHAFVACANAIGQAESTPPGRFLAPDVLSVLEKTCLLSKNIGNLLEAGKAAARARAFDSAVRLHEAAIIRVPHSLNARLTLASSLQFSGRFAEMLPHISWLIDHLPKEPRVLRYAVQAGVWGGDKALAERGFKALLLVDENQAMAARRFIDRSPPAPARR